MDLQELVRLEGVKLVDTMVLTSRNFSNDIPGLEHFKECLDEMKENRLRLKDQPGVYFVPEVKDELDRFLGSLDRYLRFLEKKFGKKNFPDACDFSKLVHKIQTQAKRGRRLVELGDVTGVFTPGELREYNSVSRNLSGIARQHKLKKDFGLRYGRKCDKKIDQHTDEKIVSASFILARREPTIIISSDSDIERILGFCLKKRRAQQLGIMHLQYGLQLYSDFSADGNYDLQLKTNPFGEVISES